MSNEIIRVSDQDFSIEECWIDVSGYEGLYMVSNLGRIKSLNYKKGGHSNIMSSSPTLKKYHRIKLSKNNTSCTKSVHRIVLESFEPTNDNSLIINHKNGIKDDNRLSNLEWVTYKQNIRHAVDVLGRRIGFIKGVQQLSTNGEILKEWDSITDASKSLGISHSSISQCCNGSVIRKTCGGFKWKFLNN